MAKNKPHIAVFFGGEAGSSDLSTETGFWICQYVPRAQYQVTPVRVTDDGKWQVPLGSLPQRGPITSMLNSMFQAVPRVSPRKGLERLLRHPVDAFMTFLRGRGGDDGALHGLGRSLAIPVVGSSLEVCQQTSDKQVTAQRVSDIVSSPLSRRYRASDPEGISEDIRDAFLPPLFVKPVSEESSVGVEEVGSLDELRPALARAQQDGDVLIQQRSPGTEVSVTLFTDAKGSLQVLPATVVVPRLASFYDHLAKRRPGRVLLNTPGSDYNELLYEAETIARDVYDELGCEGMVSVDLNIGEAATELLEINTVPTFTQLTPLRGQLKSGRVHPEAVVEGLLRRRLGDG